MRIGRSPAEGRGGFALLEFVLGAVVLTLAAGMLAMSLARSAALDQANREAGLALEAAESALARLRATPFLEVFARFNATQADDPPSGDSPGASFEAPGLNVRPGDPDGACGLIVFPGGGIELREDVNDPRLGMPRDLDGDGESSGGNYADDYVVLPVRVRVEWTGASGDQAVELTTTITGWRE